MSLPEKHDAAVVPSPGAPNMVTERSLAPLAPHEVGIRITATAINPVDWKMRDHQLVFLTAYPAILGSDAAGEIAAVGADVTGWSVGDRVFFQGIIGNYDASTFQQYCKVPAHLVARTPRSVSDEQAAGIALATMAAATGFYDTTGHGLTMPWEDGGEHAGKGKAVVVLGGSSSVGQYAIQLARLSGFDKIVTNASPAHHEYLASLGAHVVLGRDAGPHDFLAAVGDLPLAFVFDAISAKDTQILGLRILGGAGIGGHVITVLEAEADAEELSQSLGPKVAIKRILGLGSSPALRHVSEPLWRHLGGEQGYLATGRFVPNRPLLVPGGLSAVEDGLERNKRGVSGEKVVIRPFE